MVFKVGENIPKIRNILLLNYYIPIFSKRLNNLKTTIFELFLKENKTFKNKKILKLSKKCFNNINWAHITYYLNFIITLKAKNDIFEDNDHFLQIKRSKLISLFFFNLKHDKSSSIFNFYSWFILLFYLIFFWFELAPEVLILTRLAKFSLINISYLFKTLLSCIWCWIDSSIFYKYYPIFWWISLYLRCWFNYCGDNFPFKYSKSDSFIVNLLTIFVFFYFKFSLLVVFNYSSSLIEEFSVFYYS